MDGYAQISLLDMIEKLGDKSNTLHKLISEFSCPLNKDVEKFFKTSAITFAKQNLAPTYMVFTSYQGQLVQVGYYTLCTKTIHVSKARVSSNLRKRLLKFSAVNRETGDLVIVSPLIAQLGKNYYNDYNTLISGDILLKMAIDRVRDAQKALGGKTVYVECEDKPRLLDFYQRNGFVTFNKRLLERDETEVMHGEYLMQLLRYLEI